MVKSTTKLIYKPDSQSTDEYIMFVNPEEVSAGLAMPRSHLTFDSRALLVQEIL